MAGSKFNIARMRRIQPGIAGSWLLFSLLVLLGLSRPAFASQNRPDQINVAQPDLKLTGIIINSDSRSAIIRVRSGRERIFATGESIEDGIYLDEVQDKYILLSIRGRKARLELEPSSSTDDHNPYLPDGAVQAITPLVPAEPPEPPPGIELSPELDVGEQSPPVLSVETEPGDTEPGAAPPVLEPAGEKSLLQVKPAEGDDLEALSIPE